ncbi:MAG: 5'-nucleotidase C-terminal domain-containing protein [Bryobacterales bacterium]
MPVSTIFEGIPIFEIANKLGIDAFALGNHEVLTMAGGRSSPFVAKPTFLCLPPMLGADGRTIGDAPYTILRVDNGLRIGVIGLIMEDLHDRLTPTSIGPVTTRPVVQVAREVAQELAGRVDLVVALGHIWPEEGSAILREAPEVSVVVEGHFHGGRNQMERVDDRVDVGLRAYGIEVGRLDLKVDTDTKRLTSAEWTRIPVEGGAKDPQVAALVQKWEQRVTKVVDRPIGEATRELSKSDLVPLMERATLEEMNADFTHVNRGGVRDVLPKGVIREREWYNIMPFENRMMVAHVRGSQVSELLRRGRPVDPDKEYVVALMDYAVENPALREELQLEGMQFQLTDRMMRQLLIDWTRKRKVLE